MPNTNAKYYGGIPDPQADVESLRHTVARLKEIVEILTRQRLPSAAAAVTWTDIANLGLVDTAQIPRTVTDSARAATATTTTDITTSPSSTTVSSLFTFTGVEGDQAAWQIGDVGQEWRWNLAASGTYYLQDTTYNKTPLQFLPDKDGRITFGNTIALTGVRVTANTLFTFTGTEGNQAAWQIGDVGQEWRWNLNALGDYYLHDWTNSKFPLQFSANKDGVLAFGDNTAFSGAPVTLSTLTTFTGTEGNQAAWQIADAGQEWRWNLSAAGVYYLHDTTGSKFPLTFEPACDVQMLFGDDDTAQFTLAQDDASNWVKIIKDGGAAPSFLIQDTTTPALYVQHRIDVDRAVTGSFPGVLFKFTWDSDGEVTVGPNGSNSFHLGVAVDVTKRGDGSQHCFTASGDLEDHGAVGYNELGAYQAYIRNTGSDNALMSGVEVLLEDGDFAVAMTSNDTLMAGVVSRLLRHNAGSQPVNCFLASSESTAAVDAVLSINHQGSQLFKRGIDLSEGSFSESTVALFPNSTAIVWQDGASGLLPTLTGVGGYLLMAADNGFILNSGTVTLPALSNNGEWTMGPTSNTNFRVAYRGSDGTTRVGNIAIA
jgi:hypothetical protein